MKRVVVLLQNKGEAGPPAGNPPQVQPRGRSERVTVLAADGGTDEAERAFDSGVSYENEVTFTSETEFTEVGTIRVGRDDGTLRVSTVGTGHLAPSADAALLNGAVTWRVDAGDGKFEGASGLITSNFLLSPEEGHFTEYATAVLFLP